MTVLMQELRQRRQRIAGSLALFALLSGCSNDEAKKMMTSAAPKREGTPMALAVVIDPTESCKDGAAAFQTALDPLLLGCLPKGSQVAVIQADAAPRLLWAGPSTKAWELRAALATAAKTHLCACGSDPVGALTLAAQWLGQSRLQGQTKLCLGWSDLTPDKCKATGKTFTDPTHFDWKGIENVEVYVFGVPSSRGKALQEAWGQRLKRPAELFLPGETLAPELLYLKNKPL